MTWHPKPSLTVETLHWTSSNVDSVPLLSSSRLWDPDSKGNAKFTFIREHNFGPLSSSPVLFVFSPGETLLTLSVVQEWLDTRNATAETHVLHTSVHSGSWSTDSSCSPLFVNLPHIFEWVLFHNPLQGAVIPIACTLFSTTSFPSLRLSINVLGHSSVNSQPLLQWPFVSCPPCARCQWSSFGTCVTSVCVEWMYTLYKFHFLNGISEINQLFDDILIIWPAPVYIYG